MNLIDRHILSEWLKTFVLALGVTLGLLLLEDLYDDLPDFLGFGAGPGEIVRYYWLLVPSFLPTVLPLALLVSILMSLGGLHSGNEIIAMHSCGLSLLRITRTLWLAGICFTGLLLYLNAHLVPWSVEQSRLLRENLEFSSQLSEQPEDQVGLIHNLAFHNRQERRLWFMNRFSEYTYQGYGITVSTFDERNRETARLVAGEGFFDDIEGHWVFLNGREITFGKDGSDPIRSLPFDRKIEPAFQEDPNLMKALEKRPKDLSFFELRRVLDKLSAGDDPRLRAYEVRYNGILANPFSALIVVGLAAPFAVSGVRVNAMIGVAKSFGLFFLYYLGSTLCTIMGERGLLAPLAAAWLPIGAMLLLALWLHRKAI